MNTSSDQALLELLPWYINNTLDAQQRADIDALLSRSDEARRQLAELQALATAVKNQEQQLNNQLANSHELGWARLQKTIRSDNKKSSRNWWQPSLAAAAAVIVALQLTIIYRESLHTAQPASDWQTLGSASQQRAIAGSYRLQLRFVDNTQWETIRTVLLDFDAQLIDGPSALGIVQVAIPENPQRFADGKALLQLLQQQPAIQHAALVGSAAR